MEICSAYRCAVTQHQCTVAVFNANCSPHCSVVQKDHSFPTPQFKIIRCNTVPVESQLQSKRLRWLGHISKKLAMSQKAQCYYNYLMIIKHETHCRHLIMSSDGNALWVATDASKYSMKCICASKDTGKTMSLTGHWEVQTFTHHKDWLISPLFWFVMWLVARYEPPSWKVSSCGILLLMISICLMQPCKSNNHFGAWNCRGPANTLASTHTSL